MTRTGDTRNWQATAVQPSLQLQRHPPDDVLPGSIRLWSSPVHFGAESSRGQWFARWRAVAPACRPMHALARACMRGNAHVCARTHLRHTPEPNSLSVFVLSLPHGRHHLRRLLLSSDLVTRASILNLFGAVIISVGLLGGERWHQHLHAVGVMTCSGQSTYTRRRSALLRRFRRLRFCPCNTRGVDCCACDGIYPFTVAVITRCTAM